MPDAMKPAGYPTVHRRTLMSGLAWSIPAVTVAVAPAYAASATSCDVSLGYGRDEEGLNEEDPVFGPYSLSVINNAPAPLNGPLTITVKVIDTKNAWGYFDPLPNVSPDGVGAVTVSEGAVTPPTVINCGYCEQTLTWIIPGPLAPGASAFLRFGTSAAVAWDGWLGVRVAGPCDTTMNADLNTFV